MSSPHDEEPIRYRHTQNSPLFFIMILIAGAMIVLGWIGGDEPAAQVVLLVVGGIFLILAFSFYSLTTTIQGQQLRVQYGPIPLFGTCLDLNDLEHAEVGQTALIDGWGIHYIPFRGWTFNLWGFNCVKIQYRGRIIRVGTDDAANLSAQLTEQTRGNRQEGTGKRD